MIMMTITMMMMRRRWGEGGGGRLSLYIIKSNINAEDKKRTESQTKNLEKKIIFKF